MVGGWRRREGVGCGRERERERSGACLQRDTDDSKGLPARRDCFITASAAFPSSHFAIVGSLCHVHAQSQSEISTPPAPSSRTFASSREEEQYQDLGPEGRDCYAYFYL